MRFLTLNVKNIIQITSSTGNITEKLRPFLYLPIQRLICVEDGIDSSKDSGKLMISVLSAVAEIERENILVQTMEGRCV